MPVYWGLLATVGGRLRQVAMLRNGVHIFREDVPTASIPIPPVRPTSRAAVTTAAKPTETVVESPAREKIEPGIRHDERIGRVGEPSPIKASMPAHAGRKPGRTHTTG